MLTICRWTEFATNISIATNLWDTSTRLVGGAFAESSHTIDGLSPQGIFTSGIRDSQAGSLIKVFVYYFFSDAVMLNKISFPTAYRSIITAALSAPEMVGFCKT